jgi:hypothetical protein
VFRAATIECWAFDVEALVIARLQGWRIREVPIEWRFHRRSQVSVVRDPFRKLRQVQRNRANAARGAYHGRR